MSNQQGGQGQGGASSQGAAAPYVAGAQAAAQAYAAYSNYQAQKKANQENSDIAAKNRRFQLDMSNTAYQRSKADLLAAGLNPALAYGNGGASTSSGSSAHMEAEKIDIPTNFAQTALEAMRIAREFKQADSQIALNEQIEKTQKAQEVLNLETGKKVGAEAQKILFGADADKQEGQNRKWNAEFEARPEIRMYDQTIKRALQGTSLINNAVDVINPFRFLKGWGNKSGGTQTEYYGPQGEHTGTIFKRNLP